jgi:response regulator RpfG family c-di-GMP phosphodiesterase
MQTAGAFGGSFKSRRKAMFHILLVEDILNTLEMLRELLKEEFPNALIETAQTVYEGRDKIRSAILKNRPFSIAILDFKVPEDQGHNPEVDEKLCKEISSRMPETLVIHITAFDDDPVVIKHIARYHTGVNAPRVGRLIQKNADWSKKLLGEIKSYLVERQMNELFGPKAMVPARNLESGQIGGGLTQPLAALIRDIVTYWDALDDETKERVRGRFSVNDEQMPVRVSLRLDL